MAKQKQPAEGLPPTSDYRHGAKRRNIPPAKIAGEGEVPKAKKVRYAYSPHLDPVLRFDPTGRADRVAGIVEKVCRGDVLQPQEQEILRAVGKNWEQPWLEWAGKQEEQARGHFAVDPVALHIHERVSAQAVLRNAMRQDVEASLFGASEQSYSEALQFYQHDVDWANRLILGDSLEVMSSLAQRENLAGKVQMIYIDPPYGINFASNFQPEIGRKDVKEKDEYLPREAETVRAYRDAWSLGTSSYLSYLHQRLVAARQLLAVTGSLFIQISDENLHRVRALLDETLGARNFVSQITFRTKIPLRASLLANVGDHLLWYAADIRQMRYQKLYEMGSEEDLDSFNYRMHQSGLVTTGSDPTPGSAPFASLDLSSSGATPSCIFTFTHAGRRFAPTSGKSWKTNASGMVRLAAANRLFGPGSALRYVLYLEDYPVAERTNLWTDTLGAAGKMYVVQTNSKVIERCMLMTTCPGDLVLDPTCGAGTTAYVAEQWGRRWITIDTSRVAIAIARQRLLTARHDHYRTRGGPSGPLGAENPSSGFQYKTVPHITLKSIAQNANLDPIFAKYDPILATRLLAANRALARVPASLREALKAKLDAKARAEGARSVTDGDRRRWLLPPSNRQPGDSWTVDPKVAVWYDWEVPFDTDPDWPQALQDAVTEYRRAWRSKMDEVNKCIGGNAEQVDLVDQPEVVRGVVRVSGPFTVEGVQPDELRLTPEGVADSTPGDADDAPTRTDEQNADAYVRGMLDALRKDGVLFPGNRKRGFSRVDPLYGPGALNGLHAEAAWEGSEELSVAIAFGPQYGPVTAAQVESLIRASRRYHHLVVAAFSFAPEASAIIEESKHPKLQIHMAHVRPDMNPAMRGLLKETPNSQLFTVFGMPAVEVRKNKSGEWEVELEGVDIYDPVENVVRSTRSEKVAAWFLDSDFDGRCFCVCQAFFPNQDAWEKIAKALGSEADPTAFEALRGTVSLPFATGKHRQIAVKVIDPRGNEVMTLRRLEV